MKQQFRKDLDNPDVWMFAMSMQATMRKHQKKKGDSWKDCDIVYLENKLVEEIEEYQKDYEPHELVDIANMCMMLWNRKMWKLAEQTAIHSE